ncbi:hypothetical protein DW988_02625 [Bacteroides uniformis]|uniref:Uncharacterized protein n=1 Tax=Bacteroides uniformis TaxID=820 RepID=A0A413NSW5_BACUN|nr:hypothetical protein DW988_02625 [Bacteroides uniformis]
MITHQCQSSIYTILYLIDSRQFLAARFCKPIAVILQTNMQCGCKQFAVVLQNVCSEFAASRLKLNSE